MKTIVAVLLRISGYTVLPHLEFQGQRYTGAGFKSKDHLLIAEILEKGSLTILSIKSRNTSLHPVLLTTKSILWCLHSIMYMIFHFVCACLAAVPKVKVKLLGICSLL